MNTRTASTDTAPEITVRATTTESELDRHFRRWADMSGTDPDYIDNLIRFHRDGLLDTGTDTLQTTLDTHQSILAAAATRTIVLLALLDGQPAGGLIAGPSAGLATLALLDDPDTLLPALRRITILQVLAVDPTHRHHGVGTTLMNAGTAAVTAIGTDVFYGDFPDDPTLTSFFRRCGLTVHAPGAIIDFAPHTDLHLSLTPETGSRFFTDHPA